MLTPNFHCMHSGLPHTLQRSLSSVHALYIRPDLLRSPELLKEACVGIVDLAIKHSNKYGRQTKTINYVEDEQKTA